MRTRSTPDLTLGELLAKSRRAKGIRSQAAMAHRLGVSRNTVTRWETNEDVPTMGMLIAWAAITGAEWVLPEDVVIDVRFDASGWLLGMGLTAHENDVTTADPDALTGQLVGCR
jgi:transcriptional regulator with XRE-family HTH domain